MKVKLTAGAELDLLTEAELKKVLTGWRAEVPRGAKFRNFSGQGEVAGGRWTIGGDSGNNAKDTLGPEIGFVWAVTRLAVAGPGLVIGTDLYDIFIDGVANTKLVRSAVNSAGGVQFDVPIFILNGGQIVTLNGAGTGVGGTTVYVSGAAVELPAQLAWQFL